MSLIRIMRDVQKQKVALQRAFWVLLVLFLITVVAAFAITWRMRYSMQANLRLPVYGTVPDFTMTERNGDAFGLKDLKGKIWVADFIFTSCAGTCPIMAANMAKLQTALQKEWDVKLVSISVDPERDTPDILSKYANTFGAETGRWFFVTGSPKEIIHLANEGFHLSAGQLPPEDSVQSELGPVTHSIRFALIDQGGQIRGYYDGTADESVQALIRDIKILHKRDDT